MIPESGDHTTDGIRKTTYVSVRYEGFTEEIRDDVIEMDHVETRRS